MAQGKSDSIEPSSDVQVLSVEPIDGEFEVFDIQVEEDHSFIVCGVVVHNSDICIAYSGASWDLEGKPIDGNTLPYNGGVPRHWNCRSTEIPITKTFRELGLDIDEFPAGTRSSMDGQVAEDLTFDAFLKGKSKSFQDDLLGPGRADLWRRGKISLTDLVNGQGRPLTLEQLRNLA